MSLTNEEKIRYSRQIKIPDFDLAGQEKLKSARVLVIGAGGLGSPVLLYLTAAGVGTIGIVENDIVDLSNLQRQILYNEQDVDKSKSKAAVERLKALNRNIHFEIYSSRFDSSNAVDIVKNYDLVIDGSDNFPTRYLVNDVCVLSKKPYVYGAIYRFEGQVGVFNFQGSSTYRDLFPNPPDEEMAPDCATAGVLGVMAGIIGNLQALEAIKIITGIGQPLVGKILLVDALSMEFRKIKVLKNPDAAEVKELIDYDLFCSSKENKIKEISYSEFLKMDERSYQLIDVREEDEFSSKNIGGHLIPLSALEFRFPEIKKDKTVVVHCQSGARSRKAILLLQEKYGYQNLLNLKGGINAADS